MCVHVGYIFQTERSLMQRKAEQRYGEMRCLSRRDMATVRSCKSYSSVFSCTEAQTLLKVRFIEKFLEESFETVVPKPTLAQLP